MKHRQSSFQWCMPESNQPMGTLVLQCFLCVQTHSHNVSSYTQASLVFLNESIELMCIFSSKFWQLCTRLGNQLNNKSNLVPLLPYSLRVAITRIRSVKSFLDLGLIHHIFWLCLWVLPLDLYWRPEYGIWGCRLISLHLDDFYLANILIVLSRVTE